MTLDTVKFASAAIGGGEAHDPAASSAGATSLTSTSYDAAAPW